jgi:hypothetical protein
LSIEEHVRRAPFLTVLSTHSISRSLPHPPQRMPASPDAAPVAASPAPHSSAAQSNITRARSMLCGRYAPSHAGHGNTLGASCCRTCSRLCTKYGGRGVVRRALRNRSDPGGRPATAHSARAQRSRAEDTHRGPATGQRSHAQPPTPTAPAPRASASGPPLHCASTFHRSWRRSTAPARSEAEPRTRTAARPPASAAAHSDRPRPPGRRPPALLSIQYSLHCAS